jgi:hypothetical protein
LAELWSPEPWSRWLRGWAKVELTLRGSNCLRYFDVVFVVMFFSQSNSQFVVNPEKINEKENQNYFFFMTIDKRLPNSFQCWSHSFTFVSAEHSLFELNAECYTNFGCNFHTA